jgi:hypothetical protein
MIHTVAETLIEEVGFANENTGEPDSLVVTND